MNENKNNDYFNEHLNSQLEELEKLFQKELDEAKKEAEKDQEPEEEIREDLVDNIDDSWRYTEQEKKEEKEEEEEEYRKYKEDKEDLCKRCGKNDRNTAISEDYPYCSECREEMKKLPLKWTNVFLIIPFVAAVFVFISFFATTVPNFAIVGTLDKMVYQKRLETANSAYYNYKNSILSTEDFTPSMLAYNYALNREINMYYSMGLDDVVPAGSPSQMYGITYAQALISECELLLPETKATSKKIEKLYATVDSVQAAIGNVDETYEAVCKAIDGMKPYGNKYDKAIIEYVKYNAAASYGESLETQLKHLLKIKKINPSYYWLYEKDLFRTYLAMEKYNKAIKVAASMENRNIQDVTPYAFEAYAYRLKKNYKAAEKACNAGLAIDEENSECYRQLAIVKLLQGDYDSAYNLASLAYENASSLADFDVYAICCHLKGNKESYNAVIDKLNEYKEKYGSDEYALSQTVTDFIDGKLTLENIFLEGNGDVR